jgi:uncharacterized protein YhaN
MTQPNDRKNFKSSRVIVSVVALVAVAGWGAFAYSSLSSAELKQQMRGQTTALQEYQAQYLSERKKVEEGAAEVAQLREKLSSHQAEIERLSNGRSEVEAELAKVRAELAAVQQVPAPQAVGGAPALLHITPLPTKRDVIAAQEALTELGFGTLEADGVVGPTTRQAIEEFQRTAGLTVTGELHSQTLQTLMRFAKVMAAQKERDQQPL